MRQSFKIFLLAIAQCLQINSPPKQQDKKKFEILFTPVTPNTESCTERIVNHIKSAEKEILVQAYSFTSTPIIDALINAHKRGVKVTIILDQSLLIEKKCYSYIKYQYKKAIKKNKNAKTCLSLWIDRVKENKPDNNKCPLAHNKVMIIDDKKIFTGSFNFSIAAESNNAENSILINDENAAQTYKKNFAHRLNQSITLEQWKTENANQH